MDETRSRIIVIALDLVMREGRDAISTRAVCAGASVQAPTIYRLFGDKEGLIDAVALEGFRLYWRERVRHSAGADVVDDIRRGWDAHVAFGLAYPHLYSLGYARALPGNSTPAAEAGVRIVSGLVRRVARDGMLQVPEARAVHLLSAGAIGTTLQLLTVPACDRDLMVSTNMRESVLSEIMTDHDHAAPTSLTNAIIQLRSSLGEISALSQHEADLLGEWLARIHDDRPSGSPS